MGDILLIVIWQLRQLRVKYEGRWVAMSTHCIELHLWTASCLESKEFATLRCHLAVLPSWHGKWHHSDAEKTRPFGGDPLCVIIRKETIRGRFSQVQVGDNMLRDACYQMIGLRKNAISTHLGGLQCSRSPIKRLNVANDLQLCNHWEKLVKRWCDAFTHACLQIGI